MQYKIKRSEDFLYHHGILGMKWGKKNGPPYPLSPEDHSASEKKAGWRKSLQKSYDKRIDKKTNEKLDINKHDSPVTKRAKNDYNTMSNEQFRKKHYISKLKYKQRVDKYGDPYMNSPLARFGKKQQNKRYNKALRKARVIEEDIRSFDPVRDGIKTKKGKTVWTKDDVDSMIRSLSEHKLNTLHKMNTDPENEQVKKLVNDVLSDMQKDYSVAFDVSKDKFVLSEKQKG